MSSRSARIKLSPKASQDFIDILRYTGETWGEAQLAVYRDKIDAALQAIAGNPELAGNAAICSRRCWAILSALISSSTARSRTESPSSECCISA